VAHLENPALSEPVIPIVVLAAGASTRMGTPKQLLSWRGMPLLQHVTTTALQADTGPVIVVLGAHAQSVRAAMQKLPIVTLFNPGWASGPGSSIACGISFIRHQLPHAMAAIILLGDQPLVTAQHLQQLRATYLREKVPIVASLYNQTAGPPALFHNKLFDVLQNINPREGARQVIRHTKPVITLPFPEGQYDLDTPDDWLRLKKFAGG